jgi:DNA-binding CsgD family transcriptional regulator/tetratricopeptide (TPR) repeat protein
MLEPSANARFVGRGEELRRLESGLEEAAAGRPEVFVMGGEAGVGKTRLIEEFVARAAAAGATALVGGCVDVQDGGLPLGPFVQALRDHAGGLDDASLEALLSPGGADLARLLPGLGEPISRPGTAISASTQGRLFELALGLLGRMAADRPLVLVLEDLHWSDRSTRDLLAFLVRNLRAERMVLVATFRADELYRGHPLRPFLAELDRGRRTRRLDLRPFNRAELAEHLEGILGARPGRALVESVFERSQGNAFFAEELVTMESGGSERELPPMLSDILLARIESRSAAAREVLRIVAAGGSRVPERLLVAVSQLTDTQRDDALREAVEHRLLVPAGDDVYAFRHALLREAVYQELLPGERNRLHAACGAALEAEPELAGGEEEEAAADLAHHWYAAHDLPRALAASVAAGRVAERRSGFAEARAHYERALELWPGVTDAATRAGVDLVGLTLRAAEVANLAGDHGRAAALIRVSMAEVDDPTGAGLLWERLGRFLWAAGDSVTALEAYEEAVRLVPRDPPSAARARVLAARGQGLMLLSHHQESRECCEEAIAIAREVGARAEEGHALNTLGCDLAYLGDPAAAFGHLVAARRIAEEVGDLDDLARAYLNLSEVLARPLNRLDEALELAREGIDLSRRVGLAGDYGVSLQTNAADVLFGLGRWEEAAAVLHDAEDRNPIEMAAIDVHQCRAKLHVGRGTYDEAVEHLDAARRLMTKTVDPQYQAELRTREAELALWQGRPADARAAAATGLRGLTDTDDVWFVGPLLWLAAWAEADAAAERVPDRELSDPACVGRELLARAREIVAAGERGTLFVPAVTAAYALLCEAELDRLERRGDPEPWRRAAEAWDALARPFPATYARWRQAETLLGRRRAREGAEVLVAAHAAAEGLGAAPLARELALLAGRARVDLANGGPPEAAGAEDPATQLGLTRREREVLGLVAEGLTNREIAQALFVTEKTAGAHVSSILAKLHVRSRLEAATAAQRLGLV